MPRMMTFSVLLTAMMFMSSPRLVVRAQNGAADADADAYLALLGANDSVDKITQNPRDRMLTIDDFEPATKVNDLMALSPDARIVAQSTCKASVVVAARPVDVEPILNSAETWVLSRHTLEIVEVLKGQQLLKGADHITYVHPSGSSTFRNKRVSTIVAAYPPLDLSKQYLLFLQPIPQTGHYALVPGAPVLQGENSWSPHSARDSFFAKRFKQGMDKGELLAQLHSSSCGGGK